MKKPLAILSTAIAAALGLLLLSACANPFITPRERENPAGEGRGLVRIETGAGPARTVLPDAVFDHYVYNFSYNDGPAQVIAPITAGGDEFELEPGNWTVAVEAYAGPESNTLAAQGSGSFSVNLGEETQVTVKLSPIVSSGTGTLDYALVYPGGAVVNSFTLTLLAGEEDIDLLEDAMSGSGSLAGTITAPSGYYLARAFMQKNGIVAGKNEVVHIYNNLTTDLELEFVDDNFKAIVVVSSADSGPGTLREALTGVRAADSVVGATIRIDLPEGDRVITLRSFLPQINKSLVIEGNGTTLTRLNITASATSQLLYVNDTAAEVRISRMHFTGGRATNNGAAVRNIGRLTLESCIFSDNRTSTASAYGGAVYSSGTSASLTISGCTFYENTAGTSSGRGGAVYVASGSATLTGNVFWKNSAVQRSVVYGAVTVASGGFNVSDKESGTDNTLGSGWTFINGDKQAVSLPISYISFRPIGGGDAVNRIDTKPDEGYPGIDFYGVVIPEKNAVAGAVQTATTGTGFLLDYASIGPGAVSVTGGTVDDDGFASAGVTLTASESANGVFRHWIVDGGKRNEPSEALALTVDKDTTVRAVFYTVVTSPANSGPGTLWEALAEISDGGGIVLPEGQTITLNTVLPQITKSLVIEGNGATLTQRGFTTASNDSLLRITDATAEVRIDRLHFKGGRAFNYGGAIYNTGTLTLESCIFSDNQSIQDGGAINSRGSSTIIGCAFYGNAVIGTNVTSNRGGAVYVASGSATLTGNVFWGNTANLGSVGYYTSGFLTSGGFNVSDKADGTDGTSGSGWTFINGDKQTLSLPFSSVSFRPLGGSAAIGVITERPPDYPTKDFYGVDIPLYNAAAGAAQTTVAGSGHFLDYAPQGPGTVNITGGTVDSDGFASSSVSLTASENANGVFRYWTINNGVERRESSNPLALDVTGNTTVRAVFYTKVTSVADSGPGTLRDVLAVTSSGEGIILPAGQTITLKSALPEITKSFVIEGNGATLTQNGITSTLLSFNNANSPVKSPVEVRISRLHFKGGGNGAISNAVILTLESCIFSDNRTTNNPGGAIYTTGATSSLTVSGCTFYGNTSSVDMGGAIRSYNGPLTLTGNVFWGNTAASHNVVYIYGSVLTSGGFNVSDKASGTDATMGSGWTFTNGDKQVSLPISPVSFKPISGGEAIGVITTRPPGYPEKDFYGVDIPVSNAAAGAIQTATMGTGYYLDYAATGPGTVSAAGLILDEDGLLSGGSVVTLTAQANDNDNGVFMHWTIDGVKAEEQSPPHRLAVTMDDHKAVRAIFYFEVTSAADDGRSGTLRKVLAAVGDGSGILLPAKQTITLFSALPVITGSLVIEGNGATLTQSGFSAPLLYIYSTTAVVRINRLHFTGGRVNTNGGAINNRGKLTLESCIFSDNQTTERISYGGAVYTTGASSTLTISGCTFYGNTAGTSDGSGGAVYIASGTATLTGNIFWGNTANQRSVVYGSPASGGYNVSDKAEGTDDTTGSGWTFVNGDTSLSGVSFDDDLRPSHPSLPVIPSPPVGNPDLFPLRYFDGTLRETTGAAPGAMPAQAAQ